MKMILKIVDICAKILGYGLIAFVTGIGIYIIGDKTLTKIGVCTWGYHKYVKNVKEKRIITPPSFSQSIGNSILNIIFRDGGIDKNEEYKVRKMERKCGDYIYQYLKGNEWVTDTSYFKDYFEKEKDNIKN